MPRGVPRSGTRMRVRHARDFLGGALGSPRPAQLEGVAQHGGEVIPPQCPKCHAEWLYRDAWEARCLCGRRFYRTVGVIRRTPSKEVPA